MTAADLAALERLLAEATRGEWGVTRRGGAPTISIVDAEGNPAPRTGMRPCGDAYPTIARLPADYSTDDANAALIASAVNALPALIAAARERDEWQRAAESQNRQWSQKCEALTEERARREELAAQLLATQQDRYRILSERDALRAQLAEARALLDECGLTITLRSHHTDRELLARIRAWLDALDGKEDA